LEAYPLGCLNIHASLLPRWRGAAPIQRAVEAGDTLGGVTIMQIAEGLDTGDMLHKGEVQITESMTGGELHDALAEIGANLIAEVLANPEKYPPQKQNESEACYAQKLDKDECKIDFEMPVAKLYDKIRAFSPYPAMFFEYGGERFKVLAAQKTTDVGAKGEIISGKDELIIAAVDGALKITQIQRQGKRPMTTEELLRGFSFAQGTILK
jgi:methionyl-tRNA formyltransferase